MRILVVDDDRGIRDFLKKTLKAECFEVDLAEEGDEGFFLASTNEYDLLILDNKLPRKSGKEICKEIRQEGKTVPILMLSVLSEPLTKAELLNIGADDYLNKPFSLEELLARIRALLRRERNLKSDIINLGNLNINKSEHSVCNKGKGTYLTSKEFMILELLARNQGKVVSRGMFLEHVWDMNADIFSNAIEVHVSKLRSKLKTIGLKEAIFTIPGRGYKLVLTDTLRKT